VANDTRPNAKRSESTRDTDPCLRSLAGNGWDRAIDAACIPFGAIACTAQYGRIDYWSDRLR